MKNKPFLILSLCSLPSAPCVLVRQHRVARIAEQQGANASFLFEHHRNAFNTEGFNVFFGGGTHFAVWNSNAVDWETDKYGYHFYTGVDAIIGLEYVIAEIPVSIGLDWKPSVNFISDVNLMMDDIALSVRFLFK